MLKVTNVIKTFGDIIALKDISFEVTKGEFVFITGPSGSGKTTLLRLILHDLIPDSGSIIFEGQDITKIPKKAVPIFRQKIGTVFQDFKVLPEKTVSENVGIALAVIGVNENEWEARIARVLELVGLHQRHRLFPAQLSGGELQRLSLARALVVNPKIILADEPTGNLDWKTAYAIVALFEKINKEGKTILMATHHEHLVNSLKKRVIELKEGRLTPEEDRKTKEQGK